MFRAIAGRAALRQIRRPVQEFLGQGPQDVNTPEEMYGLALDSLNTSGFGVPDQLCCDFGSGT
jgi:hypothetical protein